MQILRYSSKALEKLPDIFQYLHNKYFTFLGVFQLRSSDPSNDCSNHSDYSPSWPIIVSAHLVLSASPRLSPPASPLRLLYPIYYLNPHKPINQCWWYSATTP